MTQAGAATRRAWLLNLDAEQELEHGASYTRGDAIHRRLREATARVQGLVRAEDVVVPLDGVPGRASEGARGDAWCPTPWALERLRAYGATVADAPSLETLRRVNDRAFAVSLDPGPLGSRYLSSLAQLRKAVADIDGPWLLKRALSFAGRGLRRGQGPLRDEDVRWSGNALRRGLGVVVEPFVDVFEEFAQHGYVTRQGVTLLGAPTAQVVDAHGAWQASTRLGEPGTTRLHEGERASLDRTARRVGAALAAAGYFGPFGIDAFRYCRTGEPLFNPLVELNARYCMGWAVSGCPREATPSSV